MTFWRNSIIGFGRAICMTIAISLTTVLAQSEGFYKLKTMPGPEDIALDLSTGAPRLIISCDGRRRQETEQGLQGSIMVADIKGRRATPMKIVGDGHPVGDFHPHGISLIRDNSGKNLLYVISHGVVKGNSVFVYEVRGSTLYYRCDLLSGSVKGSDKVKSPNDLIALPDGRIFMTANPKMIWIVAFTGFLQIPVSDMVAFTPEEGWSIVDGRLKYANGIDVQGESVLVSTSLGKKVWSYKLDDLNAKRKKVLKASGSLDNFQQPQGNSDRFVTLTRAGSHIAFIKHSMDSTKEHPCGLLRLDTVSGALWEAEVPKGCLPLNAASTVLEYDGKLYVGHVFDADLTVITDYKWLSAADRKK